MSNRGMGRGRGGGGGGFSNSLNMEPFAHGKGPIQPPPIYPPLLYRPLPLECTDTDEYLLALKGDLLDYLKESPAFFQPIIVKDDIQRYSDRYQTAAHSQKRLSEAPFEWSRFPQELLPLTKKRKAPSDVVVKKKAKKESGISDIEIGNRLKALEKLENEQDMDDDEKEENKDADDEEEKEGVELDGIEDDPDDEMDIGTDYVNNYFDNGETYLDDDDDRLDDEPVF